MRHLFDAFRRENIADSLFNGEALKKILLFQRFRAGIIAFAIGAVIIIIRALVLASAAFAAHGGAAMTTERFALKQVFNVFAPICGGRMFMNRNKLLNFFKGVIINHAFAQAGNDFAFIEILADIGGINERTGKRYYR